MLLQLVLFYLFVNYFLGCVARGILVSCRGIKPVPLALEAGTTKPPEKSLQLSLYVSFWASVPVPVKWDMRLSLPHRMLWGWKDTVHEKCLKSESHSVVSDSLRPHGLYSPWNSPGQNTGVGSLSLLQGIFPTQRSNPGLPHCKQILYQLSHKESSRILEWVAYPFFRGSSRHRN